MSAVLSVDWLDAARAPVATEPWACNVCIYGEGPRDPLQRRCSAPDAGGATCERARRPGGSCGPEASLMAFPVASPTVCLRCKRPIGVSLAIRCPCLIPGVTP